MTYPKSNTAIYLAIIGLIMAICPFCRDGQLTSESSRDYYVGHMNWLGSGQVYIYHPVNDQSLPKETWHYRFIPGYRGNFVQASQYNDKEQVIQKRIERLNDGSADLISIELLFVSPDTTFVVTPRVIDSSTFMFSDFPDNPTSRMQIDYWDTSADSVRVVLTKARTMEGQTEFEFDNKTYPAIEVRVDEVLETETEGFTTTKWSGKEIYAQGLGLVYYKKPINEFLQMEYVLREIVPFSQFSARADFGEIPELH